jgi:hypothetical protein
MDTILSSIQLISLIFILLISPISWAVFQEVFLLKLYVPLFSLPTRNLPPLIIILLDQDGQLWKENKHLFVRRFWR